MEEYSLLLLKPDCLKRGLVEEALKKVKNAGMKIVASKKIELTEENVKKFYINCLNEDFFDGLSRFMQSGPVMAFIVRGTNVIDRLTELAGHREPSLAGKGTIRKMGINIRYNLAHSSRTRSDFLREISVIWGKQELRKIGIITKKKKGGI